jgi:DNA-binding MarR family transcriptional regulator
MVQATIRCPVVEDAGASLVPDLYRVVRRLRRLTDPQQADVATLMLLHRLACAGPTRPSDLAGELGLDLSTVSRHARSLAEAGLVSRDPDPEDGRSLLLALTQSGADYMTEAFHRRQVAVAAVTAAWEPDEQEHLRRLLRRLADDLDATDPADPAPADATDHEETR